MKSEQEKQPPKKAPRRKKNESARVPDNGSKQMSEREVLLVPMIPLRGLTVFPGVNLTFDVAREKSREAVKVAMEGNQLVFLTSQLDASLDWPSGDEVYQVGCVARIRQILELPGSENMKLLVEGRSRARLINIVKEDPFYLTEVSYFPSDIPEDQKPVYEAYRRQLMKS